MSRLWQRVKCWFGAHGAVAEVSFTPHATYRLTCSHCGAEWLEDGEGHIYP